jgi:hypothetical protein
VLIVLFWLASSLLRLGLRFLRLRDQVLSCFGGLGAELGVEVLLLEFAAPALDFEFIENFADYTTQQTLQIWDFDFL